MVRLVRPAGTVMLYSFCAPLARVMPETFTPLVRGVAVVPPPPPEQLTPTCEKALVTSATV